MNDQNLIPLTQKQLDELRKKQYEKQGGYCALLGIQIDYADAVFDHKHKLKKEECGGPEGLGCLRGVVHRNANSFEGKLERLWKRYGLVKFISLPDLLEQCADYIRHPPMKPEYIHPNEKPKQKDLYRRLTKTEYKRICKFYFIMFPNRKVLPKYTDNVFIKDQWEAWLEKANRFNKLSTKEFSKLDKEQMQRGLKLFEEIKWDR